MPEYNGVRPKFSAGRNIAIKVPPHQFEETVRFYRDILGFEQLGSLNSSYMFSFGAMRLWIDKVPAISQAEVWLEIHSPDSTAAAAYLADNGVTRCDEIEPLPPGFSGFWISNPAEIVHLMASDEPA